MFKVEKRSVIDEGVEDVTEKGKAWKLCRNNE